MKARFSNDPAKRQELYQMIETVWTKRSYARFGQLIAGIAVHMGGETARASGDPFYIEDEDFLAYLKKMAQEDANEVLTAYRKEQSE